MNDIDDEKRKIDLVSILAEFSSLSSVQMMARLDETIEDIESLFKPHGVCAVCKEYKDHKGTSYQPFCSKLNTVISNSELQSCSEFEPKEKP